MPRNQRKLQNLVVRPRLQLKLGLSFMLVGGLILSVIGLYVLYLLADVQQIMGANARLDFQSQTQINDLLLRCVEVVVQGFIVFILASFVFAIVVSHRVSGPQVAISAYIEQLKQGNYDHKRALRDRDELQDIMLALNELAAILEKRTREGSGVNAAVD